MAVLTAPARISVPTTTTNPWNIRRDEERPFEIHGQAADQIFEETLADVVGDDHHREERNQRGEHQAVDENDHAGFFEVGQLGVFDFAIDLGERFFAAHGQHGMAESDENRDDAEHVRQAAVPPSHPSALRSRWILRGYGSRGQRGWRTITV